MPVAIYARVSTEEQRERQSIENQHDAAQIFCEKEKLSIYRTYDDDGISGTVPMDERPIGKEVLRDARLAKFDELLVYRFDRLGRDTRHILNTVHDLKHLGIRVRSMTEACDISDPTGEFLLTALSGVATLERAVIRKRSLDGTNRLAAAGAWLGGIVPFGYRKVGDKRDARLVVSDAPIPGCELSEADVIRLIYRMAAVEKRSCVYMAEQLSQLRVPCAYQRDDRLISRGKRKQRTSGLWRPSRIRNLIVSTVYKGIHEYGKRSKTKGRQTIQRAVPPIVDAATWDKAQANLTDHFLFGKRNTCNHYLLRGLMKCSLCDLTYVGVANVRPSGKREAYYRCNGNQGARGLYGRNGERCPSKAIKGEELEQVVWSDVEQFLRNPGVVIERLQARMRNDAQDATKDKERLRRLRGLLEGKAGERIKVVGLYRRGRLNDSELDQQVEEIDKEAAGLSRQIEELEAKLASSGATAAALDATEGLLRRLRERLDQPLSFERKRQLVELLVGGIRIETNRDGGKRENIVTVTYRFASATDTCTDTDS